MIKSFEWTQHQYEQQTEEKNLLLAEVYLFTHGKGES